LATKQPGVCICRTIKVNKFAEACFLLHDM